MKLNFVFIKNAILCVIVTAVIFAISLNVVTYRNSPTFKAFKLTKPIKNTKVVAQPLKKNINSSTLTSYKLVGFRAAEQNASVILEKGQTQFVLQLGDFLDNTYKLHAVGKDKIEFLHNGSIISLPNSLTQ